MSLDAALAELMIDTVTLAGVTAKDAYGKRTYATAVSYAGCRVQTGDHKVLDSDGQEKVAVGRVYMPGAPSVTLNHKLTLPDGSQPPLLSIERKTDEVGNHHTVLHFGSASG